MKIFLRKLARSLRRGVFAIGTGVFLGLIAAFGLVAPVFQKNLVVYATPSDALPPCPEYQALLDQNLNVLYAKDGDVQRPVMTTFDYARLALYPDGKAKLEAAERELHSVQPSRLGSAARVAWAINVHNLDVIATIVRHGFPGGKPVANVREIQDRREGESVVPEPSRERPDGISRPVDPNDPWSPDPPAWLFSDTEDGFDEIERSLSSPDRSFTLKELDPRVHFALNRGSRGSPPLHPKAYRAETLDAQLEDVTRGALLGSKHLRWNGMTKELAVSRIFEWYASDFGGPDSAFAFVMKHIPTRTADQIRAAGFAKIPGYIDWEWTLNQTPSR